MRHLATFVGSLLLCAAGGSPAFAHGALAIGGSTSDAQYGFAAGYSWNQPTKAVAEQKALEQCRSYPSEAPDKTNAKCAIVANYSNAWLVIAMDPDAGQTGFGYAINTDRAAAEANAMGQCRASSPDERKSFCKIAGAKRDEVPGIATSALPPPATPSAPASPQPDPAQPALPPQIVAPPPPAPPQSTGGLRLTPPPTKQLIGTIEMSLDLCLKATAPDEIIRQCTIVIRSGQVWGPDLASILNRRAIAHFALRDYDSALADLDRAILADRFNEVYSENRKLVAAAAGK